jgi:hypothetical protein
MNVHVISQDVIQHSVEPPLTDLQDCRPYMERPAEWKTWAIFYDQNGLKKTLLKFDLLKLKSDKGYWATTLGRYKKDLAKKDKYSKKRSRFPVYGQKGNDALCMKVQTHLDNGLPVKDATLRMFLIEYLVEANRSDILKDIAGNLVCYVGIL